MTTDYWCERALVDGAVVSRVSISVLDGRIAAIVPSSDPPPGATRLPGLVVPGFANAHSHAFHRAAFVERITAFVDRIGS